MLFYSKNTLYKIPIRQCHLVLIPFPPGPTWLNSLWVSLLSFLVLQPLQPLCCSLNMDGTFLHQGSSLCSQRELRGMLSSQMFARLSPSPPKHLSVFKWHLLREAFPDLFLHSHYSPGSGYPLVLYLLCILPGSYVTFYHAFIHSFSVSSI